MMTEGKTMADQDILAAVVTAAVAKYHFTTSIQSNLIVIRDSKGRVAGNVNTDGVIDRKYLGKQVLMGAIVRDAITAAIKAAQL